MAARYDGPIQETTAEQLAVCHKMGEITAMSRRIEDDSRDLAELKKNEAREFETMAPSFKAQFGNDFYKIPKWRKKYFKETHMRPNYWTEAEKNRYAHLSDMEDKESKKSRDKLVRKVSMYFTRMMEAIYKIKINAKKEKLADENKHAELEAVGHLLDGRDEEDDDFDITSEANSTASKRHAFQCHILDPAIEADDIKTSLFKRFKSDKIFDDDEAQDFSELQSPEIRKIASWLKSATA